MTHPTPEALRKLALAPGGRATPTGKHVASCDACAREIELVRSLALAVPPERSAACPEAEDLVELASSRLDGSRADAVRSHLRTCVHCTEDFEGLVRSLAVPSPGPLTRAVGTIAAVASDLAKALAALAIVEPPQSLVLSPRGGGAVTTDSQARGLALYRKGKLADAAPLLERALASEAAPPEMRTFLAACYMKAGRTNDAIEQLETLVVARPKLAEYRWQLAQALLVAGRGDDAAEQLRRVSKMPGIRKDAAKRQLAAVAALVST